MIADICAGTLGGIAVVFVGHPFDTTKTRLQTAPTGFYRGTVDCVKKTLRWEGYKGFYAGILSPLAGQMLFRATSFTSFHQSVKIQTDGLEKPTATQLFRSGAFTGFVIAFVECPIDLLKTKVQVQIFKQTMNGHAGPCHSVLSCARNIVLNHGFRPLWQGLSATLIRNVPANALFFPIAELVKHYYAELDNVHVKELSMSRSLTAGAIAGLTYWVSTYPLDVIKARMQSAELGKQLSWMGTARSLYQQAGWRAFTTGFAPCALRAIPACATMFAVVDTVRSLTP
eukprot:gene9157-10110_t